jgi:phenylacetate-CoA ligase
MNLLKIVDLLSGKSVFKTYSEYNHTQWYNQKAIHGYQNEKLRDILEHACNTVPFYFPFKEYLSDSQNIYETLKMMPVITKEMMKSQPEKFRSKDINNIRGLQSIQTGGTTGNPLKFYIDMNVRNSTWAAYSRFYDWMGVKYGDPQIVIWGAVLAGTKVKSVYKKFYKRHIENITMIDAFSIQDQNVKQYIKIFERRKPRLLRGYCQSIYELAKIFKKYGYRYKLQAISTTVEPLFDEYRDLFREIFSCETFDQYGCAEVMSLAFECEAHSGLHVSPERAIIETGKNSEIIITDLDNRATPFIRYQVGDQVTVSNEQCTCGRQSLKILNVKGRTGDVIQGKNGIKLHPEYFTHLLNENGISYSQDVVRYQVHQMKNYDIEFKYIGNAFSEKSISEICNSITQKLGSINISIKQVKSIPNEKSGKYRYVRSDLS